MATRYYIGHSNAGFYDKTSYVPGDGDIKWSTNPSRAKFNFTITNGYFYYSNLVGTIANGQTVFALCNDESPRPDLPIGVISELNTSVKSFYVSTFAHQRVIQNPNYVMCSGTPAGGPPVSGDTIILDDKTGPIPSISPSFSITYTKIDCTGFSGSISNGYLRTTELVLSTTTRIGRDKILYLTGSSNLKFGIVGNTPIPEDDLGYNYYVSVLADRPNTTLTLTSNVLNKNIDLDCYSYGTSVTLDTANFDIDVDSLNVSGNFNAGTSSIAARYLLLNVDTPEYNNNTSLSNIKARTVQGDFTCNTFAVNPWRNFLVVEGIGTISANSFNLDNTNINNLSFIKLNGGTVQIKNSELHNIAVQPINTFYASNSINEGGNTNINFSTNSIMTFF